MTSSRMSISIMTFNKVTLSIIMLRTKCHLVFYPLYAVSNFIYLLTDSLNDFWPCINTSFLFEQKRLNVPVDISLKGDFGNDQSFIEYVSVHV